MRYHVENPSEPHTEEALRKHPILYAWFTLIAGALVRAYSNAGMRP